MMEESFVSQFIIKKIIIQICGDGSFSFSYFSQKNDFVYLITGKYWRYYNESCLIIVVAFILKLMNDWVSSALYLMLPLSIVSSMYLLKFN